MNSAFTIGIVKLVAAGIKVIGYVATGYGANAVAAGQGGHRSLEGVLSGQIERHLLRRAVQKGGYVAYYRDLSQYAKAKGLTFTVGNPGTDTAEAYVGAARHDAHLRERRAAVGGRAGWLAREVRALNFGVIRYHAAWTPRTSATPAATSGTSTYRTTACPTPGTPCRLLRRSARRARVARPQSGVQRAGDL